MKRLYMQILEHFRHLLVVKMGVDRPPLLDVPLHETTLMKEQVKNLSLESINQVFSILFQGEADVRLSPQPKLALEALFVKLVQLRHLVSFDQIMDKLDGVAKRFEQSREHPEQRKDLPSQRQETLELSTSKEEPQETPKSSEDLAQIWKHLLSASNERYPFLVPSLEKAALTKIAEDFLEITVGGNSFYAARLRDEKSIAGLQKMCEEFFKRKMKIKILDAPGTTGQSKRPRETDRARRLKKEALNHPLVADAIDVFKGRVVDVKILQP
jgi:DNA polymerase-3 subunit gamma/tau